MKQPHLIDTLIENWLSVKEAETYLSALELWVAPVSSIARNMGDNRVTIYATMKNLIAKWVAKSSVKNSITYYSVLPPQELLEKNQEKIKSLEKHLPEFIAMTNKHNAPMRTQFYEGLEWLKLAYKKLIIDGASWGKDDVFYTFVWAEKINPALSKWLENDFVPWRLTFPNKTFAIVSAKKDPYSLYNARKHNSIVVDLPEFSFSNELIVYGKDKVAILLYESHEMAAMLIQSKSLHQVLKAMFLYFWDTYKPQKKGKILQKKR